MEKNNKIGEGIGFERIRRITGYLVGTIDRFNNGKKAEEKDRGGKDHQISSSWKRRTMARPPF